MILYDPNNSGIRHKIATYLHSTFFWKGKKVECELKVTKSFP